MKNLYKKGKIHPSPAPPISTHLALLPATVLTLTAVLSPQDKEVLAYLISSTSSGNFSGHRKLTHKKTTSGCHEEHTPMFECDCFRCYTSYWVRWDTSPNRQIIHEIIDAYEDGLFNNNKKKNVKRNKKEMKRRAFDVLDEDDIGDNDDERAIKDELGELESVEESCKCEGDQIGGGDGEVSLEKGSLRKLVSSIGEKIWGVWYR